MKNLLSLCGSRKSLKMVASAFCVVLMFLFITVIALPFFDHLPVVQASVMKASKIATIGLMALAAFYVIPLVQHLKQVKNGAPLFTFPEHQSQMPWPVHSHPVARNISWEPVDRKHIVLIKKTRLVAKSLLAIKQTLRRSRAALIVVLFGLGVTLAYAPTVLAQGVSGNWAVYYFFSFVFFSGFLFNFFALTYTANIKISGGKSYIKSSRFCGLFDKVFKPHKVEFLASEVVGVQILRHLSGSAAKDSSCYKNSGECHNEQILAIYSKDESHKKYIQYELILVLSEGSRLLLSKGGNHSSILKDAITLAKFLGVNIWDRSMMYRPDHPGIVSPIDQVIQPL